MFSATCFVLEDAFVRPDRIGQQHVPTGDHWECPLENSKQTVAGHTPDTLQQGYYSFWVEAAILARLQGSYFIGTGTMYPRLEEGILERRAK